MTTKPKLDRVSLLGLQKFERKTDLEKTRNNCTIPDHLVHVYYFELNVSEEPDEHGHWTPCAVRSSASSSRP